MEYMRAGTDQTHASLLERANFAYLMVEYVAPLGSTSLIFNFLFANALVGTPVTSTDIYVRVTSSLFILLRRGLLPSRALLWLFWESLALWRSDPSIAA